MKKSLIALAVLAASGAAMAQSSVTLYGVADMAVGKVSQAAGGLALANDDFQAITSSTLNNGTSRFGLGGTEDLGGGLKAGFNFEGGLSLANGAGNLSGGQLFSRAANMSLMGGFGEIRLGRDFTPSFWNTTVYDAFGTNGIAQAMTPGMGGGNQNNAVRANNTISYFLPGSLGGVQGQFQYGWGENVSGGSKTNNYFGFRVGYAAGPISTHVAYGKTDGGTLTANDDNADVKYLNVGFSFDAGVVKPMVFYGQEKTGAGAKVTGLEFSIVAPVGAGEIRGAYSRYDVANSSNDWTKLGVGYVHNLSKRSAVYAQYARVTNKGAQTKSVSNNGLSAGGAAPGGNSSGLEFGVRHAF